MFIFAWMYFVAVTSYDRGFTGIFLRREVLCDTVSDNSSHCKYINYNRWWSQAVCRRFISTSVFFQFWFLELITTTFNHNYHVALQLCRRPVSWRGSLLPFFHCFVPPLIIARQTTIIIQTLKYNLPLLWTHDVMYSMCICVLSSYADSHSRSILVRVI